MSDRKWPFLVIPACPTGRPTIYGLAVDDAHHYRENHLRPANPGRGWIVVKAAQLTVVDLIEALETGNFYASTGVELQDIVFEDTHLAVTIIAAPGVSYRTQFIGTIKAGCPYPSSNTIRSRTKQHNTTGKFGDGFRRSIRLNANISICPR